ncbi:MAG: biotin--[acetyl-CoA-carboxylase] ligase [Candidatus Marinamargulisbacteria bacterium]|nr:biotin--[acetyl-CoA-carboxylase] ligase [Candidatus Marinamargulisbacteria bacterium]
MLPSVDSTQAQARRCLAHYGKVPSGLVVWARQQTQGSGQRGRPWVSDRGGIYMTVVLPMATESVLRTPTHIPEQVANACQLVVSPYVCSWVKQPNDIMIGDQKLGGVLCESLGTNDPAIRMVLIGIGLNINQLSISIDSRNQAVSLRQVTGQSYNESMFVSEIAHEVSKCL